jgi:hypothetical protein
MSSNMVRVEEISIKKVFFFPRFSDVAWPAIIFWCEIHNKRRLLFLKMQQSKKFRVPDRQIQTVFLNLNH